jgi:hypothetical protein
VGWQAGRRGGRQAGTRARGHAGRQAGRWAGRQAGNLLIYRRTDGVILIGDPLGCGKCNSPVSNLSTSLKGPVGDRFTHCPLNLRTV